MTQHTVTWDRPTRILHWAIAVLVISNLFFIEEDDFSTAHQVVGYAAAFLVMVRGVWGFYGSEPSRFRSFPLAPREVARFTKELFTRSPTQDYPGHNPLASWTYIGIWTVIIALGISGFMMTLDAFWGDETLEEVHEALTVVLQCLLAGHLAGMTLDALKYRRLTWLAMIRGRR